MTVVSGIVQTRTSVAIVHYDREALMKLSIAAVRNGMTVTASETSWPVEQAIDALQYEPDGLIVALRLRDEPVTLIERCAQSSAGLLMLQADDGGIPRVTAPKAACVTTLSNSASTALVMATFVVLIARRNVIRER